MKFDKLVKDITLEAIYSEAFSPRRGPDMSSAYSQYSRKELEQTVGEGEAWDVTNTETGKLVHSAAAKEDALAWARSQPRGQHFSIRRVRQS